MRRLDIVGFGIGGALNMTLGANALIKFAERVFVDIASPERVAYLNALGIEPARVIDVAPSLQQIDAPRQAYQAMAERVLEGTEGCERTVFVVQGNPQLYNIPVRKIVEEGRRRGWEVVVHPAVSSLDTILIDLDLRIEETGLLVLDAGRMLAKKMPPSPAVATLIMQLGACTVPKFIDPRTQTEQVFVPLRDWLLQFYPGSHPFIIIRSAVTQAPESFMRIDSTVGGFSGFAPRIDYYCSGFLPPPP